MKKRTYKSMETFEKKFFPISYEKRLKETMDVHTLAIVETNKFLKKVRRQLKKEEK